MKKPNIVFITTDHQRADSIGMIQCEIEVTPNLNRLASEGVQFTRAYNASPICAPARTALATGIYPTKNGIVCNDWKGERAGDFKPIHQCLADGGYSVGHIGVHHVRVKPELRERVDFSCFIDNADYSRYLREQALADHPDLDARPFRKEVHELQGDQIVAAKYSNTVTGKWPHSHSQFMDNFFAFEACDFIQQQGEEPFALFVSLWAPHPPLQVPEPYDSRFDPAKVALPENVGVPAEGEPPNRRRGMPAQLAEGVTEEEWRKVWSAHLGLTRLADDAIGRILRTLELTGHRDDTIVVFSSDHGDHLGQHSMYQKMEMYEQALRVPMIWRLPGGTSQVISTPVSHLDVMPSLLELAGVDGPDDLDGISLVEAMNGRSVLPERSICSQYSGNPTVGVIRRSVVNRRYKYIFDPEDHAELYDLEKDPLEMKNLALSRSHDDTVAEMHKEGRLWAESHGDWVNWGAV